MLPTNLKELLIRATASHREIYDLVGHLKNAIREGENETCESLADIALVLRESETLVEDVRKTLSGYKQVIERLCCLKYLQDSARVMGGKPIKTENVTASPDMKVCAKIPTFEKSPAEYEQLMTYLGIDPVLWDRGEVLTDLGEESTEVVRVHWPGFQSLLTRLQSQGLPLPDGIDPEATYKLFSLRMRKKGALITNDDLEAFAKSAALVAKSTNDAIPNDEEIPF